MATKIKHVYGNVLRLAIPLTLRIRSMIDKEVIERDEPFYPDTSHPVYVDLYKGGGLHKTFTATMDENVAIIEDKGETPIGLYQVEVKCTGLDGNPYRYMVRSIIDIVDATIDAGIESGIEFNSETHSLEGAVFIYAKSECECEAATIEEIDNLFNNI